MSDLDVIDGLFNAVLDYDGAQVKVLIRQALDDGRDVQDILEDGLIAAMDDIGAQFSDGEIFVPEMLIAANAMKGGLELLRPILAGTNRKPIGRVVIGTVQGDLHDIGKNLVSMSLEGAGFDVIDIGVDTRADQFVDAIEQHHPQIVALSALLTTTMGSMRGIIERIKSASPDTWILVGGAPVNAQFAAAISADGFGNDATAAVIEARRLMQMSAQSDRHG